MFELPELITLARQINETLKGKRVTEGRLGNARNEVRPHSRYPDALRSAELHDAGGGCR